MNRYQRLICQEMFLPNMLADIGCEWNDAVEVEARAWIDDDDTTDAEVTAVISGGLRALKQDELDEAPDIALQLIWTALAHSKTTGKGRIKFSVEERHRIYDAVIRRALLWKAAQNGTGV